MNFSQYVHPDTVDSDSVTVFMNGNPVSGSIVPLNEEFNYDDTAKCASVFAFVPDVELDGNIAVSIDGSDPTEASAVYIAPIVLTESPVVKAIAVKDGCARVI